MKTFWIEYTGNTNGETMTTSLIGKTFEVYEKNNRYCNVDRKWSFYKYNVRVIPTIDIPEELFEI